LFHFYRIIFSVFLAISSLTNSYAKGPSPYLSLSNEPLIELELQRLATVAKLPVLTKPYHAATINHYLDKIVDNYPVLHQRISSYLKRYKKDAGVTHASINLNYSSDKNIALPNQRGQMIDNSYQLAFSGFWQVNQYLIINGGGQYFSGGDYIKTNSFASFGWDVLQLDVGYREHWISPFQESAVLLSTQAPPPFSLTVSNSKLLTNWHFKYEMSVSFLEEQEGIRFDKTQPAASGEPALLSMHFSIQPYAWWTIGLNRTMMFSGGEKDVSLGDIWQAIIDPVNSDNCGGAGTELQNCSEEFGNQQASITNKFDLHWYDTDFSIYHEFAGEDTNDYKNYLLGNKAHSLGLFIPYLTEKSSLNIEHTLFEDAWYVHHIYGEGYSNAGIKMGHWWGSMKDPKDGGEGNATSIRLNWQTNDSGQVNILYRTASFDDSAYATYQQAHEIEIKYNHVIGRAFAGIGIYVGRNAYGENFFRTNISYTW